MSLDTAFALIGFAFVMSISPGPANFLLLASGANFGFRRSLPLVFGISLGFLAMVFAVGVGFGEVLRQFPPVLTGLRLACAAYVLWLAVKIGRSRSLGSGDAEATATPVSFAQAALLQLLNPKAWAVALIVTVSFTDPADYLRSLLLMSWAIRTGQSAVDQCLGPVRQSASQHFGDRSPFDAVQCGDGRVAGRVDDADAIESRYLTTCKIWGVEIL